MGLEQDLYLVQSNIKMGLLDKHILKKLLNYDRNKYLNNIEIKYIFWSNF